MDADRCVSCGAVIPEGRQVCPKCGTCAHVWDYDGLVYGDNATWLDYKCQRCGAHRVGGVYGGRKAEKEDKT